MSIEPIFPKTKSLLFRFEEDSIPESQETKETFNNSGKQQVFQQSKESSLSIMNRVVVPQLPQISRPLTPLPELSLPTERSQQEKPQISEYIAQECAYHPNMKVTNFCMKSKMPLCPKCLTIYLKERESSNLNVEIEDIDKVLLNCKLAVSSIKNEYTQEIRNLEQSRETQENLQERLLAQVSFAKEKAIRIISTYFENIQQEIIASIDSNESATSNPTGGNKKQFSNKFVESINIMKAFAVQKEEELHRIAEKLEGDNHIKQILRLLNGNYHEEQAHFQMECKSFIEYLEKFEPTIAIDDSQLYNFNIILAKFAVLARLDNFNSGESQLQNKFEFASKHYASQQIDDRIPHQRESKQQKQQQNRADQQTTLRGGLETGRTLKPQLPSIKEPNPFQLILPDVCNLKENNSQSYKQSSQSTRKISPIKQLSDLVPQK